jgi:hypothetical protein
MTHTYVHSLLKLIGYAGKNGFSISLFTVDDSLITRSRNTLLTHFLDAEAATHLMFIDADIGFDPEQVHRLLALEEEVVAGMYPVKVIDWAKMRAAAGASTTEEELRESGLHFVGVPCAGSEREERSGFVTGVYAGTGFMMIKRSAIDRMIAAYPETRYRVLHTAPAPAHPSPHLYNLFDCMIEPETGAYLSEDFTFCHRFRRIGGKIWLDTESRLRHVGVMEFKGSPAVEITKYDAPATAALDEKKAPAAAE